MTYEPVPGDRPIPAEVLARASIAEVNGGENEPIGTIYKPEGVALVLLDALRKAGYMIVHADDVLDFLERSTQNPLGTPFYSDDTPWMIHESFCDRFDA